MTEPHPTMVAIGDGIALGRHDRAAARTVFSRLWTEIGAEQGDPVHRCAIAHSMADVQDDAADELRWDLLALDAAASITDEQVAAAGIDGSAAGLLPSLHLNVGECYRRLGDVPRARDHQARGVDALSGLADSGYRSMVQAGLENLGRRLRSPRQPTP